MFDDQRFRHLMCEMVCKIAYRSPWVHERIYKSLIFLTSVYWKVVGLKRVVSIWFVWEKTSSSEDMIWVGMVFFTGPEAPWLFENVPDLNHPKKTDNWTWLPQIWPGLENASFSIRSSQREWLCKQWDILTFNFFMLLLLQVVIVNTNHSLPIVSQKFECLLVLKVHCFVFNQVRCVCLTDLPLQSNIAQVCALRPENLAEAR